MPLLINDRALERRLIRRRQRTGADRFDEIWEGTYVMAPDADNQHQGIVSTLNAVIWQCVTATGLGRCFAGVNISDREDDWRRNFRIPDIAVFLQGTSAVEHENFWFGGPDFAVEIVSRHDRTDEKIPFYDAVGVRELLIVDRNPWRVRLYRRIAGRLSPAAESTPVSRAELRSEILPLTFQMVPADGPPHLRILHHDQIQSWTVTPSSPPPRPPRNRPRP